MLADAPLPDDHSDRLGFRAYADAVAGVLDHPNTDTPLTVAISAPWGAGKTSLAHMIAQQLVDRPRRRGDRSHIICWFNAWMHDDAPHLGAAFAAEVAREANRHRARRLRLFRPLPGAMLSPGERWRRELLIVVGSFAAAVLTAFIAVSRRLVTPDPNLEAFANATLEKRWTPLILLLPVLLVVYRRIFAAAQAAARFVDDPRSQAATGSMRQVRDQLGTLISQATRNPGPVGEVFKATWPWAARWFRRLRGERRRLILIVDDLERCRPPRAVEVCEVASQLLGHRDVATILLADMSTVATAAEIKYAALETVPNQPGVTSNLAIQALQSPYGRGYLQKLVQLQFDLPPAKLTDLRRMITADANSVDPRHETASEPDGRSGDRRSAARAKPVRALVTEIAQNAPRPVLWLMMLAGLLAALLWNAFVIAIVIPRLLDLLRHIAQEIAEVTQAIASNDVGASLLGLYIVATIFHLVWGKVGETPGQRAAELIDETVKAVSASGETEIDTLRATVLQSEAARRGGVDLTTERLERFLTDDSILRQEVESDIVGFLPGVPRSAKRLVNHLRLLLVIASERRMLGGIPPLEPAHLGKWVVLVERWPEIGRAVRANPAVMALLERAAAAASGPTEGQESVDAVDPITFKVATSAELASFLRLPPVLAPVSERLVFCLPSATVKPAEEGRAASSVGDPTEHAESPAHEVAPASG